MSGDWIKIRAALFSSPKVNGIARYLESDHDISRVLSTGFSGHMSEIVTRNVMRDVTVASLVRVWCAANEHTSNGVFKNTDPDDIDDIAGIPGFCAAMEVVGWAIYDDDECTVTLPNFNEYNTCGQDRERSNNAERQRRYREKQKGKRNVISNVTSNVTDNVTDNGREEKRREDVTVSKDTGAAAPPREETIWRIGVQLLTSSGSSESSARSLLGKYAKQDEGKLAEVIGYLAANQKIEPKAYIAKAMQPKRRSAV